MLQTMNYDSSDKILPRNSFKFFKPAAALRTSIRGLKSHAPAYVIILHVHTPGTRFTFDQARSVFDKDYSNERRGIRQTSI